MHVQARGVKVLVWDMDHTMTSAHCGSGLPIAELDAYVAGMSPA